MDEPDNDASKDTDEVPEGYQVLAHELEAATAVPSVFVNRMVATNTAAGMRISFGERASSPDGTTHFRFSGIMPYDDAEQLALLIERQLKLVRRLEVKVGPDGEIIFNNDKRRRQHFVRA